MLQIAADKKNFFESTEILRFLFTYTDRCMSCRVYRLSKFSSKILLNSHIYKLYLTQINVLIGFCSNQRNLCTQISLKISFQLRMNNKFYFNFPSQTCFYFRNLDFLVCGFSLFLFYIILSTDKKSKYIF